MEVVVHIDNDNAVNQNLMFYFSLQAYVKLHRIDQCIPGMSSLKEEDAKGKINTKHEPGCALHIKSEMKISQEPGCPLHTKSEMKISKEPGCPLHTKSEVKISKEPGCEIEPPVKQEPGCTPAPVSDDSDSRSDGKRESKRKVTKRG